jgi:hypothetical protein
MIYSFGFRVRVSWLCIVLAVFLRQLVPSPQPNVCPVLLLVLFRAGGKTPDPKMQVRSYMDVMKEQHLTKEEVCS